MQVSVTSVPNYNFWLRIAGNQQSSKGEIPVICMAKVPASRMYFPSFHTTGKVEAGCSKQPGRPWAGWNSPRVKTRREGWSGNSFTKWFIIITWLRCLFFKSSLQTEASFQPQISIDNNREGGERKKKPRAGVVCIVKKWSTISYWKASRTTFPQCFLSCRRQQKLPTEGSSSSHHTDSTGSCSQSLSPSGWMTASLQSMSPSRVVHVITQNQVDLVIFWCFNNADAKYE